MFVLPWRPKLNLDRSSSSSALRDIVGLVSCRAFITSIATNHGSPLMRIARMLLSDSKEKTAGFVFIVITFVVRLITTEGLNLTGGELDEVETTGYKGPGQPFGCPAQPTIIWMQLCFTHKKTACAVSAPL